MASKIDPSGLNGLFDLTAFRAAIAEKRSATGTQIFQLAKELKINRAVMHDMTLGFANPSLANAIKLCGWMERPIDDFVKQGKAEL